jgi:hypothetical protein
MKAFRDNRRRFATLVVTGGQATVGEQQGDVKADGSGNA